MVHLEAQEFRNYSIHSSQTGKIVQTVRHAELLGMMRPHSELGSLIIEGISDFLLLHECNCVLERQVFCLDAEALAALDFVKVAQPLWGNRPRRWLELCISAFVVSSAN